MQTMETLHKADYNNNLTSKQESLIELVRSSFRNMYDMLEFNDLPKCREVEKGIERLEEAQMWIIKGISHS